VARRGAWRGSVRRAAVLLTIAAAWSSPAKAQDASGFAVERFYPSAPGGGWLVMDDLSMKGGLGGAISLSGGYAYKPLRVGDGPGALPVVRHEAFADIGAAVTYDRFRVYLNLTSPLVISGEGGAVAGRSFVAPSVDVGTIPDLISDARIGLDARLVGAAASPVRLGAGAQLLVPNGARADYDTDGTYRGMLRLHLAGEAGIVTYAAQTGVHVRPLNDAPTPGSPEGSELLFGVAGGPRLPLGAGGTAVVFGPEIFGETAFRSFGTARATGVEILVTGRLDSTLEDGTGLRAKLGAGGGVNPQFGAPELRAVLAIELVRSGSGAGARAVQ
jgi:hypothetical protein